ncbi:MAG TPA: hypothetical protein VFW00_01285 [Rhodocyclaceae bacterium]|nr:hypothetical protein [Rhodocyclaceae bacterium]
MDMTTEHFADINRYGEEVLNANWLPQAMLQLGLLSLCTERVSATKVSATANVSDPDNFLQRLYKAQE